MWLGAADVISRPESPSLPASLQAALTASPEECPWEIPLITEHGSQEASLSARQQAWARQSLAVWEEDEWHPDRSPILDDAACTNIAWEEVYQGRYPVGLPLMSRTLARPSNSPRWNRSNWLLVEIGPRPAWLPITTHGRLQTPDVLFEHDNQDLPQGIRCRRAMVQLSDGYFRKYLSVWVAADDDEPAR